MIHKVMRSFLLVMLCISAVTTVAAQNSAYDTLEKVSLQLKWLHSFQFAGYYAADKQGFYREEGLDVTFIESSANAADHLVESVLTGIAEYGVWNSDLINERILGKPVVLLAVIFQHSPYIVLSRKDAKINTLSDLIGRKVAIGSATVQFQAMLRNQGLSLDDIDVVSRTGDVDDIISGRADAIFNYITDQPQQMRMRGFEPAMLRPINYGIDFYGDSLFTSEAEIEQNPERVAAFRRASLKGWEYAMRHEDELIELILSLPRVRERGLDFDYFRYEAEQMKKLILPELIQIGHINPGRLKHIADTYVDLGLVDPGYSLEDFEYSPNSSINTWWLYTLLFALAGMMMIAALSWVWVSQLRSRVQNKTKELRDSENHFRLLTDNVTDIVWTRDMNLKLTYITPSIERVSGFSVEEKMVQTINQAMTSSSVERIKQIIEDALTAEREGTAESDRTITIELDMYRKDGSLYPIETSISFMRNGEGEAIGLVGVNRDITERKQSEKILHQYKHIVSSSNDMMAFLSTDYRYLAVNGIYAGVFNKRIDEIVGHTVIELFGEEFFNNVIKTKAETCLTGKEANYQGPINFPGVGERYMDVSYTPHYNESRDVITGIVIIARDITDRQHIKKALQESEERLELAIEGSQEGVWDWNVETNEVFFSKRWKEMLGYDENLIGNTLDAWKQRIHPDDSERVLVDINRHFDGEIKYYKSEYRILCMDGSYLWVQDRGKVVSWTDDHKPRRMIGTQTDISERKQAEQELYESEQRLLSIYNTVGDVIFQLAVEPGNMYRFVSVNNEFLQVTGLGKDQVIGKFVNEVIPEPSLSLVLDHYKQAIQEKRIVRWEETSDYPTGVLTGEVSIAPLFNKNGECNYLVGAVHNITERKQVELALQASEAHFRTIFENAPVFIDAFDNNGRYVLWNKQCEQTFGWTIEELNAHDDPLALFYPDPVIREQVMKTVTSEPDGEFREWYPQTKDGRTLTTMWANFQLSNDIMFSLGYDITDQKMIQDELEKKETELRTLINTIPDLVWLKDTEGAYIACNSKFELFCDKKEIDIVGKTDYDLVDKELADIFQENDQKVLATNALNINEEEIVYADDGHREIIETIKAPLHDSEGKIIGVFGIARDITDRKKTQELLFKSENKYRTLFEKSADATLLIEGDKIVDCNSATVDMLGYSNKKELLQAHPSELSPQMQADGRDSFEKANEMMSFAFDQGSHRFEWDHKRKNGEVFPVEVLLTSVPFAEKNVLHAVWRDISERKKNELDLRESEANFSTIANSAHEGIIVLNDEGRVAFWNAAAEQLFGYQVSEAKGKRLTELIIPEKQIDAHNKGFKAFRKNGKGAIIGKTIEIEAIKKDGSLIETELSVSKGILNDKISAIAIIHDITQRKITEKNIQRLERALRANVEIMESMISAESEQELLAKICTSLVHTAGYKLAWIGFAEQDENKTIRPVAHSGLDKEYVDSLNVSWADNPRGQGPIGTAVRTKEVVVAKDIENNPDYKPRPERVVEQGYKSFIALPLIVEEKVLGTINIYSVEQNVFDDNEIDLLQNLSEDVAFGIDKQRLLVEKQTSSIQFEESLIKTIEAIAITVEKRDPYTSGHMQRVSTLAVRIATEMGLPDEQIRGIELGATIHDIGKIYIPGEILNRPGKLSAAEFEMIKTHSQVGYDIVKGINFIWPVAEMILQHHEKLDGSGYPNGLKGDQIIIEAQIMTVADVVEAITSHRPYRPALGMELGIKVIKEGKRTLFNPDAVDACVKIVSKSDFSFD